MYDTVIIGAGMSGLAAGIRLAYYDQRAPPLGSPPLNMLGTAPAAPPATDRQHQREAEERWNRWIAKGLQHDEAVARRFKWAACVIIVGLMIWMLLTR